MYRGPRDGRSYRRNAIAVVPRTVYLLYFPLSTDGIRHVNTRAHYKRRGQTCRTIERAKKRERVSVVFDTNVEIDVVAIILLIVVFSERENRGNTVRASSRGSAVTFIITPQKRIRVNITQRTGRS